VKSVRRLKLSHSCKLPVTSLFIIIIAGQNVFPKDPYIEVGSSINIVCQNNVQGKIYWTLNSERIDKSWPVTINSSHSVLSLLNFTHSSATLQCHSANTQVLGGTIIRTYTKPSNMSCILTDTIGDSWFMCTWEHQTDSSLKINYTVLWWLKVTAVSDHLLVEWKPTYKVQRKYRCQVKYSTVWIVKIENVKSCSNYTVAVRCASESAPWSDWSQEETVLTKLNQSDVKLHLWRKVAEADENRVRKVRAMWAVRKSLIATPYKQHMTGVDHMETSCDNSICDVNQDAHRINLKVFHNKSLFVEDSVYVPAIGERLPQVTNIQTSTFEGVILVSWKAPREPVSGYMIDYTHNGNIYSWKETKYTNTTLFDLLDKKPYNITVTPLFDDKTGHSTQAHQICSNVGDPGDFTNVNVQAKHKSAFVSWSVKSQEACRGAVVNYIIFYSTQDGPQLNVTVDNTTQHISLKDLNPNTQYSVYVKAIAHTGTTKSSERLFETKRFGEHTFSLSSICTKLQPSNEGMYRF
uniref:Fibronectin type-III domain-containing protein n=1 Tax=Dicentrarchus labrax TaxID=13489 RepID=A0A8C4IDC9_DICLA